MAMTTPEREELRTALDSLRGLYENEQMEKQWLPTWTDIKDFQGPDRGRFLQANSDDSEHNNGSTYNRTFMLDDTPEKAAGTLAAGFQSFLTPKSKPWFKLNPNIPEANEDWEIRAWLDRVGEYIRKLMAARGTNLYPSLHNIYIECSLFGTAACLVIPDDDVVFRVKTYTIGEYAIGTNKHNEPDVFLTKDWWTVRQMQQEFGEENLSENARKCIRDKQWTKTFLVYHSICPNEMLPVDSKKPFTEAYWESGVGQLLDIGGYHEFPVLIPRWNVVGRNVYGVESPGMKAIQQAQILQNIYEDWNIASRLAARPPVMGNQSIDQLNLQPDGVTTITGTTGVQDALRPVFQQSADLQAIWQAMLEVRESLKDTYFNKLFLAITDLTGDRRTTAEIQNRQEEKFVLLGPVLNSYDEDLLSLLIERLIAILDRDGVFDEDGLLPMPPQARELEIEIEYTSLLAQAAKAIGNNNLDLFLERVFNLAQYDQKAFAKLDSFEIINHWADSQSVPGRIMNSDEEAQGILEAIAEDQARRQQGVEAAQAAQTAATLGQAQVGDQNALEATIEATDGAT